MKIAFIGTGNMGGALAKAASKEKENRIYLVNRHPEKAEKLCREIGGEVTDYAEAVREAAGPCAEGCPASGKRF